MIFNSLDFAIFLPIIFILYWIFRDKLKIQNLVILLASYLFYGWWDFRFLSLIFFSSAVDYIVGVQMNVASNKLRKTVLLGISIVVNLGFLTFFKYSNFFLDSFYDSFEILGYSFDRTRLNIVLPVGISFYTFQTMSYSIDIYKDKMKGTTDAISFFAYVSFFPQLVAGPIERATDLLPQFGKRRELNYSNAVDGLR